MATTVDELLIKIRSDMSEFKRDLSKIQNQTQKATKSIDRSFKTMATSIKGAIGAVVAIGAVQLGRSMVGLASDVEEQTSKARVVFGQNFGAVRQELEEFGDAVGRSTSQLVNMGATVQDTFVPMGFAREDASRLSVQLTKLAVDVASFNNASDVETIQAFQSAIVGNHETVRRFGVVITEATLKQELMRMGITKNMKEVTNAEKVQARLNLIINGTTDAHNDAINTSGSFANTTKALSSALAELNVVVMTPLLPVLTGIVRGFVDATESLKSFVRMLGFFREEGTALQQQNKAIEEQIELITKLKVEREKLNVLLTIQKDLSESEFGQLVKFFKLLGKSDATLKELGNSLAGKQGIQNQIASVTQEIERLTQALSELNKKGSVKTMPNVNSVIESSLKPFSDLRNSRFRGVGFGQGRPFGVTSSVDKLQLAELKKNLEAVRDARIRTQSSQGQAFVAMLEEAKFEEEFSRQRKTNQEEFFADTKKFTDGSIKLSQARVKALQEEFDRTKAVTEQLRDTSIKAFDRITDATADLLDGTTKDFDGIRSAMSMFLKDLQRTILQLTLFNNIKNKIFGTNLPTASGGDIFDNIIGLFSGGRSGGGGMLGGGNFNFLAGGGRVQRGRPYVVGERGAEMFVPNTGGTIMNNMNTRGIGGGSTVVNQTINVDAGVSQTVRAEIINLLPVIKQDTISSLLEAKRRGGSFATALA